MILTDEIRQEIARLMDGYKNSPSNSNKYLTSMYALFEDEEVWKETPDV